MDLPAGTVQSYVEHAFRQMLAAADRLGDELVNARPLGPQTNAVAALVTHCMGVTEFWLGHTALGRPTNRDRDAELTTTATVAELHERVATTLAQAATDLRRIDQGEAQANTIGHDLPAGPGEVSVVVHVLEELYQHLGHMELAADALLA